MLTRLPLVFIYSFLFLLLLLLPLLLLLLRLLSISHSIEFEAKEDERDRHACERSFIKIFHKIPLNLLPPSLPPLPPSLLSYKPTSAGVLASIDRAWICCISAVNTV